MSDLISTQELVTKIVDTAIRKILSGEQKLTKEYEQSVKDAVNVILNTARGEIVRCKDCKHAYLSDNFVIASPCIMCKRNIRCVYIVEEEDYCSWAERREDE